MKESSTYQGILREGIELGREKGREEGREEGQEVLRASIVKIGTRTVGRPTQAVLARINNTHDLTDLQSMLDRALDAKSWQRIIDNGDRK